MKRSAVYKVHCRSWNVAKRLFGVTDAMRCDMSKPASGLMLFRALPAFRDDEARYLRKLVAEELRLIRAAERREAEA